MQRKREPTEHYVDIGGTRLCFFQWGQPDPGSASVLFAHATGFHGRIWDATIDALPVTTHVVALDQRGHGRSGKDKPLTWDRFGADLTEFVETLDLPALIGVGHSMGGHAMVQAAARVPHRFARLVLVDPVIMDPAFYSTHSFAMAPHEHPTSKRKNEWTGWREMYDRFADRGTFALWRRDVLEDYCRFGVLPNPDGAGFVLACPPLVEAAIYSQSTGRDISGLFARIEAPVVVLRAQRRDGPRSDVMDFASSPTWPALADQFARGRDVYLPQLTHFLPMQDPELVARFVSAADATA
jgi:pimeloyl-ACP methyl ester carboxylesterase